MTRRRPMTVLALLALWTGCQEGVLRHPTAGDGVSTAPDSAGASAADAANVADRSATATSDLAGLGPLDAGPPPLDAKPPPKVDAKPPPKVDAKPPATVDAGGAKADAVQPPPPTGPAQLATWVPLDWTAFPVDPGPNYKVSGKTWVVKTTGNDANSGTDASPLRTIATALSKAQSGDLVRVHGGTYVEGIPGDFRALLMDKDSVILTGAPGESVTVTPKSSVYRYGAVLEGSNVVLNAINFKGFNPSILFGLESKTQKNVVITNLTAEAAPGGSDGIADYADTSTKGFPSIAGLLLKNVTMLGAALGISCNTGPCTSWRLENVKVVCDTGSGSGADAIGIENGDNMLFYRVDVSKASADGIDTKATRVVVWDSHVHDVDRNGVKFWHGGDIVNTLIDHTSADAAVVVKSGDRVRILHSTIAYHDKGAGTSYNMTFRYDDNGPIAVDIINSIIYNTSGGAYFSNQATVKITNSLFYGMDNGVLLDFGSTTILQSDGGAAFTAKGLGGGNLVADPGLDASFHPTASSIVINKGTVLSADYPTSDQLGKPRVKGAAPDLGPFEDF
jgi:hypothetical protein